jgi:hypothetical protein
VREAGAVSEAATRKAGSRSGDTGHCQYRCKEEALHGRVPCSVPLPGHPCDLVIETTSRFIFIASISAALLSSDQSAAGEDRH